MSATQDQPISVGNLAAAIDSIVASVIASDQLTAKVEQVVADVTGGQTYWVGTITCTGGSNRSCTIDVERSQGIGFTEGSLVGVEWYGAICTLQPGTYRISCQGTALVYAGAMSNPINSGFDGTKRFTSATKIYVQSSNGNTLQAALTIIKLD